MTAIEISVKKIHSPNLHQETTQTTISCCSFNWKTWGTALNPRPTGASGRPGTLENAWNWWNPSFENPLKTHSTPRELVFFWRLEIPKQTLENPEPHPEPHLQSAIWLQLFKEAWIVLMHHDQGPFHLLQSWVWNHPLNKHQVAVQRNDYFSHLVHLRISENLFHMLVLSEIRDASHSNLKVKTRHARKKKKKAGRQLLCIKTWNKSCSFSNDRTPLASKRTFWSSFTTPPAQVIQMSIRRSTQTMHKIRIHQWGWLKYVICWNFKKKLYEWDMYPFQ